MYDILLTKPSFVVIDPATNDEYIIADGSTNPNNEYFAIVT